MAPALWGYQGLNILEGYSQRISSKEIPLLLAQTSAWVNSPFESMIHIKKGDSRGKPKIRTQLRTHSLALCRGCMWIYTQSSEQLKKTTTKNPSKVLVTQGQISLSRVLRIGYHAHKTTEIWRFDSWLQNAFLLCLRIAGNNISPFIIGRDQRPGRGHVHTLTLVPWKHKAPDESLHKKRNGEGKLDTLTKADSKLRLTASLSWQVQLLPSSTVIT